MKSQILNYFKKIINAWIALKARIFEESVA